MRIRRFGLSPADTKADANTNLNKFIDQLNPYLQIVELIVSRYYEFDFIREQFKQLTSNLITYKLAILHHDRTKIGGLHMREQNLQPEQSAQNLNQATNESFDLTVEKLFAELETNVDELSEQQLSELKELMRKQRSQLSRSAQTELLKLNKLFEKLKSIQESVQNAYISDIGLVKAVYTEVPDKLIRELKNEYRRRQKQEEWREESARETDTVTTNTTTSESSGFSLAEALREFKAKKQSEATQLFEQTKSRTVHDKRKARLSDLLDKVLAESPAQTNTNQTSKQYRLPDTEQLYKQAKQIILNAGRHISTREKYGLPHINLQIDIDDIRDFLGELDTLVFYRRDDGYLYMGNFDWVIDLTEIRAESAVKFRWNDIEYAFISTTSDKVYVSRYDYSGKLPNIVLGVSQFPQRFAKKFVDNVITVLLDIAIYYSKADYEHEIVSACREYRVKPLAESVYRNFGSIYFNLLTDYLAGLIKPDSKAFEFTHHYLKLITLNDGFIMPYYHDYQSRIDLDITEFLKMFRKPYFVEKDFEVLVVFGLKSKLFAPFKLNETYPYPKEKADEIWNPLLEYFAEHGTYERIERMIADRIASTQFSRKPMWEYLRKTIAKNPATLASEILYRLINIVLPLSFKTKNITGYIVEYVRSQIQYIMNQIYNTNKVFVPPTETIPTKLDVVLDIVIDREIRKMSAVLIDYYGEQLIHKLNNINYSTIDGLVKIVTQPLLWAIIGKQFNFKQYVGPKLKFLNLWIAYLLERDCKCRNLARILRSIASEPPVRIDRKLSLRNMQHLIDQYYAQYSPERMALLKKQNFLTPILNQINKYVFTDILTGMRVKVSLEGLVRDLIRFQQYLRELELGKARELIVNEYYLHKPKMGESEKRKHVEQMLFGLDM